MKKDKRKFTKKPVIILVAISALIFGYKMFAPKTLKFNENNFDIEKVEKGNISKTVTANGTINPVNVITVGTQVSGTVEKIYVDYNDKVEKEQILAELDMAILKRKVDEGLSTLRKSKANFEYVKLNTERTRTLFKKNYIAKVELDQAENELASAKEEYNIAESQYETSKTNSSYAIIKSPVSGTVISRNVDVGQTVAASLSAPVLFEIAEDLNVMQIETSISEADIGMIKMGQDVNFTVDAFQKSDFKGKIKQIRLNPTTTQNVVTYNVIIEIDNKEQKLLPGMTAYVSVIINEVKDILKIRNTTLRFKPEEDFLKMSKIEKLPEFDRKKEVIIYLLDGKKITPIVVKKGLSNTTFTEVSGKDLKENITVINDYFDKDAKVKKKK